MVLRIVHKISEKRKKILNQEIEAFLDKNWIPNFCFSIEEQKPNYHEHHGTIDCNYCIRQFVHFQMRHIP